MKGTTLIAVILPFVIAFGLSASFAVSRSAGYDGWFGIPAQPDPEPAPEPEKPTLDTLEKDLALEGEQKARFSFFRKYCHGGLGACRQRIAVARAELGEAILAEPMDLVRIEAARRNLLDVYEECSRDMVDNLLDLKEDLDHEQMEKLTNAFFPPAEAECGDCRGGSCSGRCGSEGEGD